jgi:hypothetical protein
MASPNSAMLTGDVALRLTSIDVVRGDGVALTGHGVDHLFRSGPADGEAAASIMAEVGFTATADDQAALTGIRTRPDFPAVAGLKGRRIAGGFRAALTQLQTISPAARLLRRLLWELPILVPVSGQTWLLDHPAARADIPMDLRGVDQCSGWRAGGEMLLQIAATDGVLRMPLGPPVQGPVLSPAPWAAMLPPLPPWATRRARATAVSRSETGARVEASYRDSYSDPDGVERALHEWHVGVDIDGEGRFVELQADPGRLPWRECPSAQASAAMLAGHRADEVERVIARKFKGIGTCTHLDDTLRSLTEVPDLLALLPGG